MSDIQWWLDRRVIVTLSLSDWLLLCGWASAHLRADSPQVIVQCVQSIGTQVKEQ